MQLYIYLQGEGRGRFKPPLKRRQGEHEAERFQPTGLEYRSVTATSQGIMVATRSWRKQEREVSPGAPKGKAALPTPWL